MIARMNFDRCSAIKGALRRFPAISASGSVQRLQGLAIRVEDRLGMLKLGDCVELETDIGEVAAEVVGFEQGAATCVALGDVVGVRTGASARFCEGGSAIRPSDAWLGRIVDGLGRPTDGKGALAEGPIAYRRLAPAPRPAQRARLAGPLEFGVRALDLFTPALVGQRLGVFAGAGVGKSTLLGMLARNVACDVVVIALIGERGREVREFVEDVLGPAGLARAVVVAATSDEAPTLRRAAAYTALSVAERFRDQGRNVLLLMDSLTRIAAAQRELGAAAGELPTARGFTPSVFSLLPAIIERAGPGLEGAGAGAITGVFSVLVEGGDLDEPVADATRALLDGHIVLDRRIADSGRFPAVDVLRSVSRTAVEALSSEERALMRRARALLAVHDDMREMIRIGAYKSGADGEVDRSILFARRLETVLEQTADDAPSRLSAFDALRAAFADLEIEVQT